MNRQDAKDAKEIESLEKGVVGASIMRCLQAMVADPSDQSRSLSRSKSKSGSMETAILQGQFMSKRSQYPYLPLLEPFPLSTQSSLLEHAQGCRIEWERARMNPNRMAICIQQVSALEI